MRMLAVFAALLLVPLAATAAADPLDCEGCKDHPDVARFPGFFLSAVVQNDFNAHEFPISDAAVASKEGRFWDLAYDLKEGAKKPSGLEIVRNYENAFKKRGGKLHYKVINDGHIAATYSMPLGKSERWMYAETWNDHATLRLYVVELAAMEQKVEVSASEMLDALNANGFIALYGITFDSGKDSIVPSSEPLLAEIATLLTTNPDLKLSIEGHTDDVGVAKANLPLSKRRAESVKKWLTGKGVAAARLSTNGFGSSKAVADNRTEEGRARNRRVELVKKK